jgi:hypothetical protein
MGSRGQQLPLSSLRQLRPSLAMQSIVKHSNCSRFKSNPYLQYHCNSSILRGTEKISCFGSQPGKGFSEGRLFGNVLDLWMSDNGGSCVLAVIGDGTGTGSLSELWQ